MLVCLIVLKCGSWVYKKFYSNKKHIGGSSSGSDPLVIITTSSRVTAATVVVFFIVLVLGYRALSQLAGRAVQRGKGKGWISAASARVEATSACKKVVDIQK
jgi:hypothetical protein